MTLQDGDDSREVGIPGFRVTPRAEGVAGTFTRRLRIFGAEAFIRELEDCEGKVRRYIAGFVHDPDIADDIFAEAVATAYRGRRKFAFGGGSFPAWIERIAFNKIREYFRRRRTNLEDAFPDTSQVHQDSLDPEESLVAQEDAARLALSLGKMDADLQAVLRLHYGEDLPIRGIAEELGLSEATVRKRLSRGRQRLRDLLRQEDVYRDLSARGKRAVAGFLGEDPKLRGTPPEGSGDIKSGS
jgi:RNA polymerase sigma factor (sigma-70 family)